MTTYLSGINPSSAKGLHIGNYFGAVKPQIAFQQSNNCFYFVANAHALNTIYNGKEVLQNTDNVFIEYLAFGIDPEKTTFYVQSDVEEIFLLQAVLNNVVTVAELQRMHGYKDKLAKDADTGAISNGLFNYPVLMAADILAFRPDAVPVGEDQTQHLEITREIARTFNNRYGEVLKVPKLVVQKQGARVMGIDGERKMSKSLNNDIPVFATEKQIKAQIMRITTDPNRIKATDPGDPEKNVAFKYFELMEFDSGELEEMKNKYREGGIGDVAIKEMLFEHTLEYFKDFRAKKAELLKNMDYVNQIRQEGAFKAATVAREVLQKVRKAVGIPSISTRKISKKATIGYDDFAKLDIRVGKIESAEKHPNADKLLKLIIDFGEEKRQVLAGIAEMKTPEELVGKQIPVLFNLAPREMRGLESQGMIMASDNDEGIVLLHPEAEVSNGAAVR